MASLRQQIRLNWEAQARSRERGGEADYTAHLVIQTKQDTLIPYAPNRIQQHFRAHRTGRDLVLKPRQVGISTEIQASHFLRAITKRVRCATLAHDDPGTRFLRKMANTFWLNLPDSLRPERGLDNDTTTSYPATGSEVFIATAGSKNKGRAGTYRLVHGSEVAFWIDAAATMAGLMQGVPEDGEIVLESTPNGAQGWFYERCMDALDNPASLWTLHFYPWWWIYSTPLADGQTLEPYSPDELALIAAHQLTAEHILWRRRKIEELGARLFQQEYPEDPRTCFLVSGVGYFSDIAHLDDVFSAPMDATYNPAHRYVTALDFGQQQDFSSASTVDATTLEEVELWRLNRVPWGDIRARVLQTCQKWHSDTLHPEANSMGSTNIEELHKEFAAAHCKTRIAPFETTALTKPSMVQALHWSLDQGGLKLLPDPAGKQELYAYTASQTPSGAWKYEGLPHDDTVIARMGAWNGIVKPKGFVFA